MYITVKELIELIEDHPNYHIVSGEIGDIHVDIDFEEERIDIHST